MSDGPIGTNIEGESPVVEDVVETDEATITDDINARAIGIPGMTGDVDRIVVSLSGDVAVDRTLGFVEELVDNRDIVLTLFSATGTDTIRRLDSAAERLRSAGFGVGTELAIEGPRSRSW